MKGLDAFLQQANINTYFVFTHSNTLGCFGWKRRRVKGEGVPISGLPNNSEAFFRRYNFISSTQVSDFFPVS